MLWFLETLRGEGAALRMTGTGDKVGLLVCERGERRNEREKEVGGGGVGG